MFRGVTGRLSVYFGSAVGQVRSIYRENCMSNPCTSRLVPLFLLVSMVIAGCDVPTRDDQAVPPQVQTRRFIPNDLSTTRPYLTEESGLTAEYFRIDYLATSPRQLIERLRGKFGEATAWTAAPNGWLNDDSVAELTTLRNDFEICIPIYDSHSSQRFHNYSTVA
jgi:hypothetical protein